MTDVLEHAKSIVDIQWLWKHYGLPGSPKRSMRSPFREDHKPSFSVYQNYTRWKDQATGEGGDAIDFIGRMEGMDNRAACGRIIELAGVGSDARSDFVYHRKEEAPKIRKSTSCDLSFGTEDQILKLCQIRKLGDAKNAMIDLEERGYLGFITMDGVEYWAVTDKTRFNVQLRHLDGTLIEIEMDGEKNYVKAKTLKGSSASWPIGLRQIAAKSHVLIVEGGPDLLAAATVVHRLFPEDSKRFGFVCITGAGNKFPEEELTIFSGKSVTIFPHSDTNRAGQKAGTRWMEQIRSAGCSDVLKYRFFGGPKDLNDFIENPDEAALESLSRYLRRDLA